MGTSQKRLAEFDAQMASESFWLQPDNARKVIDEANTLKRKVEPLLKFDRQLDDIRVLLELGEAESNAGQDAIQKEADAELNGLNKEVEKFELIVLLTGPHDQRNCIFSINAGAGGTEAQDWTEMLSRMYTRWFDSRGWKYEATDALPGEQAGLKSVTYSVQGENAYGFCKAERGVHRLVRISPFDSNKRRHTSFSSVDIIAELDDLTLADIVVPDSEIRRDTFRSGGKGGQNVNKVNSKVIMRWSLAESESLPGDVKDRFIAAYRRRMTGEGELVLSSERFRDQPKNIADCLEKLHALLQSVATAPKPRRAVKPTRASKRRRVEAKRERTETKDRRRPPKIEE